MVHGASLIKLCAHILQALCADSIIFTLANHRDRAVRTAERCSRVNYIRKNYLQSYNAKVNQYLISGNNRPYFRKGMRGKFHSDYDTEHRCVVDFELLNEKIGM